MTVTVILIHTLREYHTHISHIHIHDDHTYVRIIKHTRYRDRDINTHTLREYHTHVYIYEYTAHMFA